MSKQIEGMNLEIKALADRDWKYLTFSLENEEYGLHPTGWPRWKNESRSYSIFIGYLMRKRLLSQIWRRSCGSRVPGPVRQRLKITQKDSNSRSKRPLSIVFSRNHIEKRGLKKRK